MVMVLILHMGGGGSDGAGSPEALSPLGGITAEKFLVLQMKDSLINLQNGIGSRDFGSDPEEKRKRFH